MKSDIAGRKLARAVREFYNGDNISLYFRIHNSYVQEWYYLKELVWEKIEPAEVAATILDYAKIDLDLTAAQALMDELWQCGVRPTEGTGSAGQAAAQQAHIKDLEEISKRLLGIVEKS